MRHLANPFAGRQQPDLSTFDSLATKRVRAFHAAIEGYAPTPLVELPGLADELGLGALWVKDESFRFGLNAFKGLGTSYAIHHLARERPGKRLTLVAASAGNHGRAVAWAAQRLGHAAVVCLPAYTAAARLEAIAGFGARVERVEGTYEMAVEHAVRVAEAGGEECVLVQDSSWPGYEEVPLLIMQGYLTMIDEALEQASQLAAGRLGEPTHVLLQCGVGSFAGAIAGHLAARFGDRRPRIVVVEPEGAACAMAALESALESAAAGRSIDVDAPPPRLESPESSMACLCCGEVSHLGWRILKATADDFVTCSDEVSRSGMRRLAGRDAQAAAESGADDPRIVSGESGAVGVGCLVLLPTTPELQHGRSLDLDRQSRVLAFSTEGDTDPGSYRATVDGPSIVSRSSLDSL